MHGEINVKCISRNTLKKKKKKSQYILYFNEIFHIVSSPLGWQLLKDDKKKKLGRLRNVFLNRFFNSFMTEVVII